MKAELDLKFFYRCKDDELYRKFTECKHYKRLRPKVREKHYNTILKDVLATHTGKLKILIKSSKQWKVSPWEHHMIKIYLNQIFCTSFGIKRKQEDCWKTQEKATKLYVKKQVRDGIVENSPKLITNFCGYDFSSKEIEILKLRLQHGVVTRPVEPEIERHLRSNQISKS